VVSYFYFRFAQNLCMEFFDKTVISRNKKSN